LERCPACVSGIGTVTGLGDLVAEGVNGDANEGWNRWSFGGYTPQNILVGAYLGWSSVSPRTSRDGMSCKQRRGIMMGRYTGSRCAEEGPRPLGCLKVTGMKDQPNCPRPSRCSLSSKTDAEPHDGMESVISGRRMSQRRIPSIWAWGTEANLPNVH